MLLTRAPLSPKGAFDLHVLSLPPAFVLSQDQTLTLNESLPPPRSSLAARNSRKNGCDDRNHRHNVYSMDVPSEIRFRKTGWTSLQGPNRRPRISFVTTFTMSNSDPTRVGHPNSTPENRVRHARLAARPSSGGPAAPIHPPREPRDPFFRSAPENPPEPQTVVRNSLKRKTFF